MRKLGWILLLASEACGGSLADLDAETLSIEPTYAEHVGPLLERSCVTCHSESSYRAGGVELDDFNRVYTRRVQNVCVSIGSEVRDAFADVLLPFERQGESTPGACGGFELLSMPPGASTRLSLEEQVILARWLEIGAPQ